MRLDYLHIRTRFKNLVDFHIDFDENFPTTVIVGRNGSGKSNLLEALTLIFRDLDGKGSVERPQFSYELRYECRGHHVHINADLSRKGIRAYQIKVDGKNVPPSKFDRDEYLPKYVFGYYSGPSNRLEEHFDSHQRRFYRDLLNGIDSPMRRLFYARPVHSQFVMLAFFMEKDSEALDFLSKSLRIEGLDYALFCMHEGSWNSEEGDPRFWYARGVVQGLLDHIYELAMAPLRLRRTIPLNFRRSESREFLYLMLRDVDAVRELASKYQTQQAFFKALESTYISDLIDELRISVRARKTDGSITFREMSEGEQQLLMVLGLLRFTREEESLFLLDEPDTHLNPAGSVQYLEFLKRIGGALDTSHIIMATHDPLVVAGLVREQVQILQRDDESGLVSATMPNRDPRGMGVGALLTSDVYGLRSQLDLSTLHDLERKRELAAKPELTKAERKELKKLSEALGALDFTVSMRDPMYAKFVNAMTEHGAGQSDSPQLTPQQREEEKRLAMEIVAKLRAEANDKEAKS